MSGRGKPFSLTKKNYEGPSRQKVYPTMMISDVTAQEMKFSIKDFLSKCDQIRNFLRIWSHLLKNSLMENFIFCAVLYAHFKYSMMMEPLIDLVCCM